MRTQRYRDRLILYLLVWIEVDIWLSPARTAHVNDYAARTGPTIPASIAGSLIGSYSAEEYI